MVKDPVYNTQMGAGELSALMREYKGSLIMTFAGYNAGRGRVRDWIKLRGDPRDPNVDAVDWVERIPFSETRNYVQRVIENLGVYRVRFGTATSAPVMVKQETGSTVAAKPAEPAPAAERREACAGTGDGEAGAGTGRRRKTRGTGEARASVGTRLVQVRIGAGAGTSHRRRARRSLRLGIGRPRGAVTNRCEYCSNRLT